MRVIVCVDDRLGMTFNGRRQSRDRVLCEDVIKDLDEGQKLFVSEYSHKLFDFAEDRLICEDDFLEKAGSGDVCFVEDRAIAPYVARIKSIVIYRWNRHYPSDTSLDIDPSAEGFRLFAACEFAGNSHEKITKEIYER